MKHNITWEIDGEEAIIFDNEKQIDRVDLNALIAKWVENVLPTMRCVREHK